jgi:hypothetical protein
MKQLFVLRLKSGGTCSGTLHGDLGRHRATPGEVRNIQSPRFHWALAIHGDSWRLWASSRKMDLKSADLNRSWGFKSPSGHQRLFCCVAYGLSSHDAATMEAWCVGGGIVMSPRSV